MTRKAASVHCWMACATIGMGRLWWRCGSVTGMPRPGAAAFLLVHVVADRSRTGRAHRTGGSNYVPPQAFLT